MLQLKLHIIIFDISSQRCIVCSQKELSSRNDSSCSQADMETSECLDSEGNILGLSHRGIIPIGATCRLTLSETEIGDFVCLSNGILFEKSANIEMGNSVTHIRTKCDSSS